MGELTLTTKENAALVKAAKLTDERELVFHTKITRLQRGSATAGQEADTVAKSVITAALFGFYPLPTSVDFVVAMRDETLALVRAPRKGRIIKVPTVTRDQIQRRVEIKKSEITKGEVVKTAAGPKLYLQLSDGFTLSLDITNRIIPAINEMTKTLGYLDCWM
ncbi:MAG: hypothetical protein HFK10_04575 [Clostridia bacterium]|jgi:hypothetical protein|nr:hypothetical protein [Clostridia bacterium]